MTAAEDDRISEIAVAVGRIDERTTALLTQMGEWRAVHASDISELRQRVSAHASRITVLETQRNSGMSARALTLSILGVLLTLSSVVLAYVSFAIH